MLRYLSVWLPAASVAAFLFVRPVLGEPLDWEAGVSEASRYNRGLLAARNDYEAARYNVRVAKSDYYPQISANAGADRGSTGGFGGSGSTLSNRYALPEEDSPGSVRTSSSAGLALSQKIFTGFETEAAVENAEARLEAAQAALDIARAKASYDLKSAFSSLEYSQEYVKLAENIIRRREENLALVDLRYQNGNENKGSYLLSKASVADARLGRLQADNLVQTSQQQLAAALGRDDSEALEVTGSVPVSGVPVSPDFSNLLFDIPEDRQAVAQKKVADAELKSARSGFYPSLGLSGSSDYRDEGEGLAGKGDWQFGVQLSFPLYTGGRDYYGEKSALENVSSAQSQRIGTAQELRVRLKQTWTAFREAVERVKVDEEYLEAASSRAEIARARYNNGLLSFEDWDVIENDLITRQKNLLVSKRDRVVAEASWEQAQGKGVLE